MPSCVLSRVISGEIVGEHHVHTAQPMLMEVCVEGDELRTFERTLRDGMHKAGGARQVCGQQRRVEQVALPGTRGSHGRSHGR